MKAKQLDELIVETSDAVALCFKATTRDGVPYPKQEQFYSAGQRGEPLLLDLTDHYDQHLKLEKENSEIDETLTLLFEANSNGKWIRHTAKPSKIAVSDTLDAFHVAFARLESFLA